MISLQVEGKRYSGWTRARAVRGIEYTSGGFELEFVDRWAGQDKPWPIRAQDECVLFIGSTPVISGYVDDEARSISPRERRFSVKGRDKASDFIDSSAKLDKWEFVNISLRTLAERLCAPHSVRVSVQAGLTFAPVAKVSIDPGETGFEVLQRACAIAGVLPVSDGNGGLLLTRAGAERISTALVEGQNVIDATSQTRFSERFRRILVMGQHAGTDDFFGEGAAGVSAYAEDQTVRRANRLLIVRPDANVTTAQAQRRAEWELKNRAAKGDEVTVNVQGWTLPDGVTPWPVNVLVPVKVPSLEIDGEMLISQIVHTLDPQNGSKSELVLRRPDAFKPEPKITDSSNYWKEIKGGV